MKLPATLVCITATLAGAPAAFAHITLNPPELTSGYTYGEFNVGHGCDGSSTTRVSVKIPAGIASAKPQEVAGWTAATKEGKLEEPVSIFGEEMTEGVTEVSWTGGPLRDDRVQRFGISFFASDSLAGKTIYFPTVQQCEEGVTRWIEIPVEGEEAPEEPAPGVAILASEEEEEEPASGGETSAAPEAAATSSDDDEDGLALVFGIAGLVAGLLALGVALFYQGARPRRG
jgi:periplasmic copper chaperone A